MYNFLDHKLLPKVTTKTAALDDYEASNLISENPVVKARGFLAYTSMKPPVDIDFELICATHIHYIVIRSVIGSQRTVGVELQIKNTQNQFDTISHAYYEEEGVIFSNSRYYSRSDPPRAGSYHQAFFKSYLFRTFINARVVRIRILRTERSTPCLGSVEIWGKVSKSCSAVTVATINKLMCKSTVKTIVTSTRSETPCVVEFEISDDFKDALTYEVMAMPMTLPSGHTIDQSTLEKCIANDATYGRQSCDPFTGLPFCESRRPKLNISLKNRIDMFLLHNSNKKETHGISRTVGRKRNACIVDLSCYQVNSKNVKPESSGVNQSCSLEEAVNKVMNTNGFVCFTKDTVEVGECKNCVLCKRDDNLYVLPCKHLYCRLCLLNNCSKLICDVCKNKYCKSDVKKFHT